MTKELSLNEQKSNNVESLQRMVESKTLFGSHKLVFIKHGDQTYQLKITRQDKLILTK